MQSRFNLRMTLGKEKSLQPKKQVEAILMKSRTGHYNKRFPA